LAVELCGKSSDVASLLAGDSEVLLMPRKEDIHEKRGWKEYRQP
jgi:hypothetical protein